MTEQEIRENKPDGANYIDIHGDWWKVDGSKAWFMFKHGKKWIRYAFTDIQEHITRSELKPL